MRIVKTLIAGGTVLGALAIASPAFAAGNPVAITATVNQTISMSGPPASLNLAGDPGTTASGDVSYNVTTNDSNGYNVTVTPSASYLQGPGSNSINNSAMGYLPSGGSQLQFSGSGTNGITV